MNESGFIQKIHKGLDKNVYAWKISDRFTAGIPDCYYSGATRDLWIEYKLIAKLKSTTKAANLSALQIKWLKERAAQGRNVAVIVGVGTKHGLILTGDAMFKPLSLEDKVPCAELIEYIRSFCCDQ
jgi:hypothetical protein